MAVGWSSEDHDRELTPSGRRAAHDVGEWLASVGFVPDLALISSSARTQATWQELSTGLGATCSVDVSRALYAAEPDTALDLIRSVDESVNSLLVVGHNPTISFLAQLLDDSEGDPAQGTAMMIGFPPASVADFECHDDWTALAPSGATLTRFRVGQH